jgi:hypothetical protein
MAPSSKDREVGHLGTVEVVAEVEDARALAETWLARALPRRWRHVQSVAVRAGRVAKALSLPDDLVAAAWLHDIGYAPELAQTGFHPLDGACWARIHDFYCDLRFLVAAWAVSWRSGTRS